MVARSAPGPILEGMEAAPRRGRIVEFDLLRGAAIVAVVYLHAYFTPWPEAGRGGLDLLHFAHLFAHGAVPLFLFISAYLQGAGPAETPGRHLRHRFTTVWLPAMLWMGATLGYRLVTSDRQDHVWRDLALFDVSGQFYFIWLLLFFGLVLTQAHRLSQQTLWGLTAAAFIVNLGTIAAYEWHGDISGLYATLAYRNPAAWVFFPVLGYTLGRAGMPRVPAKVAQAAAAGMAAVALVYLYRGIALDTWPVSYFGVTIFLFSCGGLLVYPHVAGALLGVRTIARPLLGLSRYAFPIYLVHLPFAMGFGTKELLGNGADWSNYWLLLHANAFVGLFLSLAFVRELDKASPRLGKLFLGIRRGAGERRARLRGDGPAAGKASGAV